MFLRSPKVVKQPQDTGGHDDRFLHHVRGRDLNPYAVWVHAWVATLADFVWVVCGLLIARLLLARGAFWKHPAPVVVMVAALTVVALLAKEAGLAIPSLLLVAGISLKDVRWRWAFAASAAVGVAYLSLRYPILADPARKATSYGIDLGGIPLRFVGYQLFPLHLGHSWANSILVAPAWRWTSYSAFIGTCWFGLLRTPRHAVIWLLMSVACLGPSLLIGSMASQYAYGLSAGLIMFVALVWSGTRVWGRILAVGLMLVSSWHGVEVAYHIRNVGLLQAQFSPSMADALAQSGATPQAPLHLLPRCLSQRAVYNGFAAHIPSYHGVEIAGRVIVLSESRNNQPIAAVECDGTVRLPSR